MLIIPELETIIILVPRTGTNSIKNQVLKKFKHAFMPYWHMEADGVPFGYEAYRKIGVVRHPVERLWSLFKYLRDYDMTRDLTPVKRDYMQRHVDSTKRGFEHWVLTDGLPISPGLDMSAQLHMIREPEKSQKIYLRPDLDTMIYPYDMGLGALTEFLQIENVRTHVTPTEPMPELSDVLRCFFLNHHRWDLMTTEHRWADRQKHFSI